MPEKYHVAVTVGYSFVIAVIISVCRAPVVEQIVLWLIAVTLFATALSKTRKGAEPPVHYELQA